MVRRLLRSSRAESLVRLDLCSHRLSKISGERVRYATSL
jgi:hypothetical protein